MKESQHNKEKSVNVAKTAQSMDQTVSFPNDPALMIAQITHKVEALLGSPNLPAGLYLIATPIGNLSDISLRALTTLFRVDAIYCEDTRHSRKLLSHYSIRQPLFPYHDHNAKSESPKIISRIKSGERIALISDAGTPLISDPGYDLVQHAHKKNILVTALPGPSAVITALTVAGLPTDSFTFAGFLPPKSVARQKILKAYNASTSTVVFYESPKRIHKTLIDMQKTFQGRFCVLAKELTKLHETLYQGKIDDLVDQIDLIIPKGEFVILISPAGQEETMVTDEQLLLEIQVELKTLSLRDSVAKIAKQRNLPRKKIYALALSLKQASE